MGRGPERPRWSEVNLPEWQPLGWRAKRYLKERGIDEQQAASLGIVEMADRMRVIIPYFGPEGGTIYWTARSYSDLEEGPKYLAASGRHPLYVLPSWAPQSEAVLVEGVFDAIAVSQRTGKMAIALGGKACPRYLRSDVLDLCTDDLLVCLDADAIADALKLKKQLMFRRKVRVVHLPVGEDPSSLGEDLVGLLCKE
jgi:DNA primase